MSDDTGKAADAAAITPKTYSEEEFKKLIDERDKAKEKARKFEEAERKAAEDQAIKAGEFDKVKSKYEADLAKEREEKAKLAEKAAKADDLDRMARERALAKITDEKLKGIYGELSTPKLLELVDTIETDKGSPVSVKQKANQEKTNQFKALPGESYKQWQERIGKL